MQRKIPKIEIGCHTVSLTEVPQSTDETDRLGVNSDIVRTTGGRCCRIEVHSTKVFKIVDPLPYRVYSGAHVQSRIVSM
jgi:hypothetical protein